MQIATQNTNFINSKYKFNKLVTMAQTRNEGRRHMTNPSQMGVSQGRGRGRGGRGRGRIRGGGRGRGDRGRGRAVPNLPNDINAPTQRIYYHRVLIEFMSYTQNRQYLADRVFTE